MSSPHTSNSPAIYSGPFSGARPLGIDRANYIAVHSTDPAAAAKYAVEHMGFFLVHVDKEGRHYLGAHGLDPYSLVYTRGEQGAVDHISYVVRDAADLAEAEANLAAAGVKAEHKHYPSLVHGYLQLAGYSKGARAAVDDAAAALRRALSA